MSGTAGDIIRTVYVAFDLVGVAVIVVGFFVAGWRAVMRLVTGRVTEAYRAVRTTFGRSVLLGLEFLVAADIIRTIAVRPTLAALGALAMAVAIRTLLSWAVEVEIDGRWPWQGSGHSAQA